MNITSKVGLVLKIVTHQSWLAAHQYAPFLVKSSNSYLHINSIQWHSFIIDYRIHLRDAYEICIRGFTHPRESRKVMELCLQRVGWKNCI